MSVSSHIAALKLRVAALAKRWQSHPDEGIVAALWALSAPGLLLLHASNFLGDWTPMVVDPFFFLVFWRAFVTVKASLRAVEAEQPAATLKPQPVKLGASAALPPKQSTQR